MKIIFRDSEQLKTLIENARPNGPTTLESSTIPKATVKSRIDKTPFEDIFPDGVMRTKREYVWIGGDYERIVNLQREREGSEADFQAKARTWGEKLNPWIVEHKGSYYLIYFVSLNPNHKRSEYTWHTEKGTVLPRLLIDRYLQEFAPVRRKEAIQERQGLDKIIEPRTVKLEGITRLKAGGVTYIREGYVDDRELPDWTLEE